MAASPPLLALPPELLLRISTWLTTPELGAFRGSCRQVESSLFDNFAREFFTKRQFMLEHVSLEALVAIANHKLLSSRVQDVIIGLDYFLPEDDDDLARDACAHRNELGFVDRDVLLQTGKACDMLVEAFSKLSNLRTVGLRDYSAHGRYRDGETARWNSYGWSCGLDTTTRLDATVGKLRRGHMSMSKCNTIFPLVLYALGKSSVRPESIEVFLRRTSIPQSSFNIAKSYLLSPIVAVLSNLRTLMLKLDRGDLPTSALNPSTNKQYHHLKQFLGHAPNLQHLRLNFESEYIPTGDLLDWLTSMSGSTFSHLTALDLGMINVSSITLLSVISKFRLQKLSLWKVALEAPISSRDQNLWSSFLHNLSKLPSIRPDMVFLMIGYIQEFRSLNNGDTGCHQPVKFARTVEVGTDGEKKFAGPEGQVTFRKHFGDDARTWLQDLANRVYVPGNHVAAIEDLSTAESEDQLDEESDEEDIDDSDDDDVDGSDDDVE